VAMSGLPKAVHERAARRAKRLAYKGKNRLDPDDQADGHDLLLVGVGDGKTGEQWRRAAAAVRAASSAVRPVTVAFALDDADRGLDVLTPVVEGMLLAGYSFEKYRAKKDNAYAGPRSVTLSSPAITDNARTRGPSSRPKPSAPRYRWRAI